MWFQIGEFQVLADTLVATDSVGRRVLELKRQSLVLAKGDLGSRMSPGREDRG